LQEILEIPESLLGEGGTDICEIAKPSRKSPHVSVKSVSRKRSPRPRFAFRHA
jgi:hypothetical protein